MGGCGGTTPGAVGGVGDGTGGGGGGGGGGVVSAEGGGGGVNGGGGGGGGVESEFGFGSDGFAGSFITKRTPQFRYLAGANGGPGFGVARFKRLNRSLSVERIIVESFASARRYVSMLFIKP